jgi:hypothetical protein
MESLTVWSDPASATSISGGVACGERQHAMLSRFSRCSGRRIDGASILETGNSRVDGSPPRRDEVDEQGKIVDSRVPLGEDVLLEPLQPARDVVEEAADLGELTADRQHLATESFTDRCLNPFGQAGLKLARRCGQRFDLGSRTLEHRFEADEIASFAGLGDALGRALECQFIHGGKATLAVG